MVGVCAALCWLCDQSAERAPAYLVTRCARRSTNADFDDLGRYLLKLGGYGIFRICYPICPEAAYDLAYVVCTIGVVSMVWGAFAALAQTDFKRMVAYSSVSHMGYVVLGFGVWSAMADTGYNADYWKMGVNGAMYQMIGHGISSPACSLWSAWCTTAYIIAI